MGRRVPTFEELLEDWRAADYSAESAAAERQVKAVLEAGLAYLRLPRARRIIEWLMARIDDGRLRLRAA